LKAESTRREHWQQPEELWLGDAEGANATRFTPRDAYSHSSITTSTAPPAAPASRSSVVSKLGLKAVAAAAAELVLLLPPPSTAATLADTAEHEADDEEESSTRPLLPLPEEASRASQPEGGYKGAVKKPGHKAPGGQEEHCCWEPNEP